MMSPGEEIASYLHNFIDQKRIEIVANQIDEAIDSAIEAERERCAKVVEQCPGTPSFSLEDIAACIRSGVDPQ